MIKNILKISLYYTTIIICLLWIGCTEDDILEITPSSVTDISKEGGSISITVNSSLSWNVSVSDIWCTPNKTAGNKNGTVTFSIDANPINKERTASITFAAGKERAVATITQVAGDEPYITTDPTTLNNVSLNGASEKIQLSSNQTWTATPADSWLSLDKTNGTGDAVLTLTISANNSNTPRTSSITLTSAYTQTIMYVTQAASSSLTDATYQLPVIFHVFYADANDSLQYVKKGQIATIIRRVNYKYANMIYTNNRYNISQKMDIQFYLATEDPNGKKLEEAGVERIQNTAYATMDVNTFMNDTKGTYSKLLWNPNKYINIFVYRFQEEEEEEGEILGISHLPYASKAHPLEGLITSDYYFTHTPDFPYGISINNKFIYNSSDKQYDPSDIYVTVAHELGHYIGLLHTFDESEDEKSLKDTDFCEDTETYNRSVYINWLNNLPQINPNRTGGVYTLDDLATKQGITGSFISHNIMDYMYCWSDQFTPNQKSRTQYVLQYSPLIPVERNSTSTRSVTHTDNVKPPIRTMK